MFFGLLVDQILPPKEQLMGGGVFVRYNPGETEELLDLFSFIKTYAEEQRVTEAQIPPTVLKNISLPFDVVFEELLNGIAKGHNLGLDLDVQFFQAHPVHRMIFHAYREHLKREDSSGLDHVRDVYELARMFYSPPRAIMH